MNTQQIERLTKEYKNCKEPGRLLVIARALENLGAWEEAQRASAKAQQIVSQQLVKHAA